MLIHEERALFKKNGKMFFLGCFTFFFIVFKFF